MATWYSSNSNPLRECVREFSNGRVSIADHCALFPGHSVDVFLIQTKPEWLSPFLWKNLISLSKDRKLWMFCDGRWQLYDKVKEEMVSTDEEPVLTHMAFFESDCTEIEPESRNALKRLFQFKLFEDTLIREMRLETNYLNPIRQYQFGRCHSYKQMCVHLASLLTSKTFD